METVIVPIVSAVLASGVFSVIAGAIRDRRRAPMEHRLMGAQADDLAVVSMERALNAANTRATELEQRLTKAEARAEALDRKLRRREAEVEDLRVEVARLRRLQGLAET